ncbi:MAG TPA: aldo/keto reductase [bacterium]|nr:aldo/keto reductase [bacterium]
MRYRTLGRTGLYVSELCLGTMTFGGHGFWEVVGTLGRGEAEALIGQALDAGVNFIDTADVYSEGESERLTGQALANLGTPRDEIIVATKCRGRTGPGPNQVGLSRNHILDACDASLRRLGLDHIDLYQIHGLDPITPIEETVRALDHLVQTGKVRYVGFCNLPAWYTMKALAFADAHGLARFVSAQVYYSIAGRDIERELVPLCEDQGLGILPWSPLAGGLLSGKFDLEGEAPEGPEGARRSKFGFPPVGMERGRRVLAAMRAIHAESGTTIPRIALGWLLTRPYVTSVIIGAKTAEQLTDNLGAVEVALTPAQVASLDEASALPAEYPGWMVTRQGGDRRPGESR